MDLNGSLKILKERAFINFTKSLDNEGRRIWLKNNDPELPYTDREVINLAREYTSEGQRTNIKKNVKEFDHRKNRAKTRELMAHENYEDIPKNDKVHKEDIWSWD